MIDVDRQVLLQILTSAREVFLHTNGKILRADENCHQWNWPALLDIDPEVIRNVKISESD